VCSSDLASFGGGGVHPGLRSEDCLPLPLPGLGPRGAEGGAGRPRRHRAPHPRLVLSATARVAASAGEPEVEGMRGSSSRRARSGTMDSITLFVCGDVMLGRGIDQILAHPGPPELREDYVRDARDYVELAETASGPIPRPVPPSYPWGD